MKDNNRGKWEYPLDRALREQQQSDQILKAVQAAEHYNYLRKKYGPKTSHNGSSDES